MKSRTILVVAAALIDHAGRILVQRRPAGKPMAGLWEFPGGKVDDGELPEQALSRELDEELGIVVHPENLRPACFASEPLGPAQLLLLLFVCRKWDGVAHAREASELRWVDFPDLRSLEMPPADGPLIDLLEKLISGDGPIL
ncbi:MAG: (deoxy)nucleoside triphosphate pyrophosphohydrolase [Sphingomonadaceae bacterium]